MKRTQTRSAILAAIGASIILSASFASQAQDADILFKEDFSEPINGNPNPVWSWNLEEGKRDGMMLGENDIYRVVEGEQFVSHRKSLRMNFAGRNDLCNTCGGEYLEVTSVSDGEACTRADPDGYESYVYNLSNQFSTWNIIDSPEGQLCFNAKSAKEPSIGDAESSVKVGDAIFLPNICGETGTVGRNIDRRSDCDKAINQLDGVSSKQLDFGETLSRRFYLFIPPETVLPDVTFKLGYSTWQRPGEGFRYSTLKISVQRDLTLELHTPDGGKYVRSGSSLDAFTVPKDKWIYFEEVFTRESSADSKDASYTLYVSPIDDLDREPITHVDNFVLGELRGMSVGGNWQHMSDVKGYVYFDNIVISKSKVGQVNRPDPVTH
ncbi:hypothetical protein [Marinimicrobium locisalis]|uniref:hypothetical protein n=1 Tax=Marinimicrobium locisalis TaxID=546022 RepID=UPI0032214C3C